MIKVVTCLLRQHDPRMAMLAALVCAVACLTAFSLLSRAELVKDKIRRAWLLGSSLSFGLGAWATHFVAMLAYRIDLPIQYDLPRTIISALIAIIGGFLAFNVLAQDRGQRRMQILAAAILAISVGMMHFVGIRAVRFPGRVTIDPSTTATAFGLCWLFSAGAFWIFRSFQHERGRVAASGLLVLGICGLHFTAMSALTVVSGTVPETQNGAMATGLIGILVAGIILIILLMSLAGAFVDKLFKLQAIESADRFRQLADCTFEGILIHDGSVVKDANAAFSNMLGLPLDAIVGRAVEDFISPEFRDAIRRRIDFNELEAMETEVLCGDGRRCPVEVLTRPIESQGQRLRVVAARDISERKFAEAQIRHMAHHDALTGLANRFSFNVYLEQALAQAGRTGDTVHVFCLDLDRFKMVNDLLGHAAGDELLRQVTERLQHVVRAMDTAARLGGDEFAIIQPASGTPESASTLAARIIAALSEPFSIYGQQAICGVSIGIATFPEDAREPDMLLRHADVALYRAKAEGRGRFCFFEPAMDAQIQERRRLEADLRRAILERTLDVYYQPLFSCAAKEAVLDGFEALVRWNHPTRGVISPSEFIPLAEESGLIIGLGQWVLEVACAEAASWDEPHDIAVNISPTQFKHADLVGMIARTLAVSGLEPSRLELEITEGVLITDAVQALITLEAIKALGVRISLDDFGTGYSSLSYLQRFPFDKLKIDKSFIGNLMTDENSAAIVRAIIALGRSLKLEVTAEGVETLPQFDLLKSHSCTQIQGFLLGRPMPANAIRHLTLGAVVGIDEVEAYAISA